MRVFNRGLKLKPLYQKTVGKATVTLSQYTGFLKDVYTIDVLEEDATCTMTARMTRSYEEALRLFNELVERKDNQH